MSVPPGFAGGAATNEASLSSSTTDPRPADNSASYTSSTGTQADLSITKDVAPDPPVAGTQVAYAIKVANAGPSAATEARTPSRFLAAGADRRHGHARRMHRRWRRRLGALGTLNAGASVTVDGDGQPAVDGSGRRPPTNRGDKPPRLHLTQRPRRTPATSSSVVSASGDVSVAKVVTPPTAPQGTPVESQLTAHNAGPSSATDVTLVDHFAASNVALGVSNAACHFRGEDLECAFGDLAPGADACRHRERRDPRSPRHATNTASVASSSPRPTGQRPCGRAGRRRGADVRPSGREGPRPEPQR